jgi:hypothetical protein
MTYMQTCVVYSLVLMGWLLNQYLHPEIIYVLRRMGVW